MTSKIVVNNIEADSGINTVTFASNIQGNLIGNVTGTVNSTGVITATSFSGSGANLTGIAATTNVRTDSLVVSGITTVAAGSTSAPSISPTGDSNTGVFFPSADTIAFSEGGAEAARFNSSGELLVGTATRTANGGKLQISNGITFPATQSACTDVNTLDDYEEGTWTPTLNFSGGTTGITYTTQEGIYTKIGNIVTVGFYITLSNKGSSSGNANVSGLPFAASVPGSVPVHAGELVLENGGSSWPAAGTYGLPWSDATVYLRYNGTTAWAAILNTSFTNTTSIYWSATYRVS